MSERETWVDSAKGWAIILVVLGHLFQSLVKAKLFHNVAVYNYLDFSIYSFHMPLFFLLSGYLYGKVDTISNIKQYRSLVIKKMLNLGVPYFLFSSLFVLFNMAVSKNANDPLTFNTLLQIPFFPVYHFWFIYVLFGIFLVIPLLELLLKNDFLILIVITLLKFIGFRSRIFLFDNLASWAVYFYLGKIFFNHLQCWFHNKFVLIIASLGYFILNYVLYFKPVDLTFSNRFLTTFFNIVIAVLGILLSIFIVKLIEKSNGFFKLIFNNLGIYSFHIYLLHTFFAAGVRILLLKSGIFSLTIHIIVGLTFAIIFPVLIGLISKRNKFLGFAFTPTRYIKLNL